MVSGQRLQKRVMQFVIAGNGIAGFSAAVSIRRLLPGAGITIISEESHPLYSACVLPFYISGEIDRQRVFLKQPAEYARQRIKLIRSRRVEAINISEKKVVVDSDTIPYDKLVIATGSKSAIPRIKGTDKKGVFAFKTLDEADDIRQYGGSRAVVIGSGPVGMEIALSLLKSGYQVFLFEFLNRVLPRVFDDYPSSIIRGIIEGAGVRVFTEERVEEIQGETRVEGVLTDKRQIQCDLVVLASGMRPDVRLAAGVLELGSLGGICVDDTLRTSIPGIYACGDCIQTKDRLDGSASMAMLWPNAIFQGEVAGCNAAGFRRLYPGSLNITGVELPGSRAMSLGSLAGEPGDEVIEKKQEKDYLRLVIRRGKLAGVQTIGDNQHTGRWLSLILRQEELVNPMTLLACRYAARRFINSRASARMPGLK